MAKDKGTEKKELTPEEMAARIVALEAEKADSDKEKKALEKQLNASEKSAKGKKEAELVSFTVMEGKKEVDYEFNAPSIHHDGEVLNVRELEKADPDKFDLVCAQLVKIKSGVITRKGE